MMLFTTMFATVITSAITSLRGGLLLSYVSLLAALFILFLAIARPSRNEIPLFRPAGSSVFFYAAKVCPTYSLSTVMRGTCPNLN